jgi:hypothetical protein
LLRLVVRGRKGTNGVDGAAVVDGAAGSVLMNGGELGQCMGLLETMGEGSCERRLVQANGLLGRSGGRKPRAAGRETVRCPGGMWGFEMAGWVLGSLVMGETKPRTPGDGGLCFKRSQKWAAALL